MTIQMLSKLITCIILIATARKQSKAVIPEIETMINNAKSKIDKVLLSALLIIHVFIGISFVVVLFYPIVSPLIMICFWFISSLTITLIAYNTKLRAKFDISSNTHRYGIKNYSASPYIYRDKEKIKLKYIPSNFPQHVVIFDETKNFSRGVYYFFDDGTKTHDFKKDLKEIERILTDSFLKTLTDEIPQLNHEIYGSEYIIGSSVTVISEEAWRKNNLTKEMLMNNVVKKADLMAILNEVKQ